MTKPLVTIAVVPGERFSLVPRMLHAVLQRTGFPCELVFVDTGSPPGIKNFLRRHAAVHGYRLLRTWRHITPNRARNLALRHVRTRYVAFLDYDTLVAPGWLEPLVACAEKYGAAAVGPVCCRHEPEAAEIAMAGGTARIVERSGHRQLIAEPHLGGKPLEEVRDLMRAEPTELLDLHCLLARTEKLRSLGPLDEGLKSGGESLDLCLSLQGIGAPLLMEPDAVVTHVPPPPLEEIDLSLFRQRWSPQRNQQTIDRLATKWNLSPDDRGLLDIAQQMEHRRRILPWTSSGWQRWLACRSARLLDWVLGPSLEEHYG